MKRSNAVVFLMLTLTTVGFTEPILTEEAGCLPAKSGEIGIAVSYGIDAWTIKDVTNGADYKVSALKAELPVKYGINDKLQINLLVPYVSWNYDVSPDVSEISDSDAGIGQIGVGGKLNLAENIAVGLNILAPTADVDKGLGEGTNIGIVFIYSREIDKIKLSANAGYIMKMIYKDENEAEWSPADPIILKAAAEYPINDISIIGEAQGQMFGKEKVKANGGTETEIADSNGSTIDLLGGVQYLKDNLKLKAGAVFGFGSEDYRAGNSIFRFLDSWDWKIICSAGYKFGK